MPWPTDAAVERVGSEWWPDTGGEEKVRAILAAAGLPELFGYTDAAECYGVKKQNLDAIAGLPAPVYGPDLPPPYYLRSGRFWLADEIREHAASRGAMPAQLRAVCPTCNAGPGDECRTKGDRVLGHGFHKARTVAARGTGR